MRLWFKFNAVMVLAFAIGLLGASWLARDVAETTARNQVLREAGLIMLQATAVRGYTAEEIAPLLAEQTAQRFLPHTVPSWAAQTVLRTLERTLPFYDYKEAALNPTNPADRATPWEAEIIEAFRRNPDASEQRGERQTPAGPILTLARPLRVTSEGCLACHSTPAVAPAPMLDLYGPDNGFGWQLNEVIGAQIVSVPMRIPLERAQRILEALQVSLAGVFLAMLVLLNVLLHFVVIKPIRQMTASAERVAAGDFSEPEFKATGKDEIGSLARSFNLMRRSLANAMKLLDA